MQQFTLMISFLILSSFAQSEKIFKYLDKNCQQIKNEVSREFTIPLSNECVEWQVPEARLFGQSYAVSFQFEGEKVRSIILAYKQKIETPVLPQHIRGVIQVLEGQWGVPTKGLAFQALKETLNQTPKGGLVEIAQWNSANKLTKLIAAKISDDAWTYTLSSAMVAGAILKQ